MLIYTLGLPNMAVWSFDRPTMKVVSTRQISTIQGFINAHGKEKTIQEIRPQIDH